MTQTQGLRVAGIKLILLLCGALAFNGCAPNSHSPLDAAVANPLPDAAVAVRRHSDRWTADFRFERSSPAWAFAHSGLTESDRLPWRPQSWTVETPGVRLERHGWYDVLIAADGREVPERVRIRFTPFPGKLQADYEPALVFTDGSVALFSDQFNVFPVASPAVASRLPVDLGTAKIEAGDTRVVFSDQAGRVLGRDGRRSSIATTNGRTYVFFGKGDTIVGPNIATIIDPQLPNWLNRELGASTPEILSYYTRHLGPRAGARPMLMVSWKGPTPGRRSMGGSVLPSLIIMAFEGDGVVAENPGTLNTARWFIAHESAHFWLGETIRQEFARDAWISEGGADLLAIRASAAIDPHFDSRERLQSSLDDCIRLTSGQALADANERNALRAYYACGTIFGLIAEASARRTSGGNFFTFWRGLIDANRTDGIVTKDEWLAELTRVSGDPSLARAIRSMVETGVVDPAELLASLFDRTGVAYTRETGKNLRISASSSAPAACTGSTVASCNSDHRGF